MQVKEKKVKRTLTVQEQFERSVKECLIKNAVIIVLSLLLCPAIYSSLEAIKPTEISDFLLLVSIMLVTACFANFAFSYEYSILGSFWMRFLSHLSTFIFMLLIALIMESMVIAVRIVYPSLFTLVFIFTALLYLGVALYDLWDLFRKFKDEPGEL